MLEDAQIMLKISESVNSNETVKENNPTASRAIPRELLSVFYVVGIIGSFLALLHLYKKRNVKNGKQIFMLKWVGLFCEWCQKWNNIHVFKKSRFLDESNFFKIFTNWILNILIFFEYFWWFKFFQTVCLLKIVFEFFWIYCDILYKMFHRSFTIGMTC